MPEQDDDIETMSVMVRFNKSLWQTPEILKQVIPDEFRRHALESLLEELDRRDSA